jgi:hypothetical protein
VSEPIWSSPCGDRETVRDGAERFIREFFAAERSIRWGETPGEFWFPDGYWTYLLACEGGRWVVYRTENRTKKAKDRAAARRRDSRE